MARDATRGRNANAMHRAFTRVGKRLDHAARHRMLDRIDAYQRGELPLSDPIVLLAQHVTDQGTHWVAEQTYLDPWPYAGPAWPYAGPAT